MHVQCGLHGGAASGGNAQILHTDDYNAYNSFDDPNHITPRPHPVAVSGAKLQLDLPRMSVVTARLKLRE